MTIGMVCRELSRRRSGTETVPLEQANLCLDCEVIGQSGVACPRCGGMSLLPVAKVLNRVTEEVEALVKERRAS